MFDRPIPAVLPPPRADRPTARMLPGVMPRPPVVRLLAQPTTSNWTHAISRVDPSGRVADRSVLATLNWMPRDRVAVTAEGVHVIIFRRDDRAHETVLNDRRIRIPATVRRRCGIHPRDRVLLAASHELDLLVVYTQSGVEQALLAMHQAGAEADR